MVSLTQHGAERRLREIVRALKKRLNLTVPLTYLNAHEAIAQELDIQVREKALLPSDEGEYIPAAPPLVEKPIVAIDPQAGSDERLNFTFFHEVSHHLIREDGALYEFLHEFAPGRHFKSALERFCHIGAAEFLIPLSDARAHISQNGFSIRLLEQLDTIYTASKPAICIQLAQAASHQCIVVICEYGTIPSRAAKAPSLPLHIEPEQQQLYILQASNSPSFKYWPGKYVPIPKQHLLYESYRQQCYVEGRDNILFRHSSGWPVHCEAFFYKHRVYGVFNQTKPSRPRKLQPPLFDMGS